MLLGCGGEVGSACHTLVRDVGTYRCDPLGLLAANYQDESPPLLQPPLVWKEHGNIQVAGFFSCPERDVSVQSLARLRFRAIPCINANAQRSTMVELHKPRL